MNFTVEYLRTSVLSLCYDDAQLQALIDRVPTEGTVTVLLSLPSTDARRVCAGLLPHAGLVAWSAYSARRAKEYGRHGGVSAATYSTSAAANAAAVAANAASDDTASAAYDSAAYAAESAAESAAYYAAYYAATATKAYAASAKQKADHEISIRDACRLLGW